MLFLKLAFRNLARQPRRTMTICALMAFGVASLFFANSVFESTKRGLHASFVRSVTGDAAISAWSKDAYGLFGNEVPIVSGYENIRPIDGFRSISEGFRNIEGLGVWTPIVSGVAVIKTSSKFAASVPVFGVDPDTYFLVCSDIKIVKGNSAELAHGGVFFSAALASDAEGKLGRRLSVGERIRFSMYSNGSFKIRAGSFAGIFSYPGATAIMERLVLADPTIVRGIADYTLGFLSENGAENGVLPDPGDLDDLFRDPVDLETANGQELTLENTEARLSDTLERDLAVQTDAAAWSFVLFRAKEGQSGRMLRSIKELAVKEDWQTRVLDWRGAAGFSAQSLFAVQGAFYVGMGFIALGAMFVIMNSLVIFVLERTSEIGTMRGLGADSRFVRRLFLTESMLMTMLSACAGLVLAGVAVAVVSKEGIRISNPLLITLFGGVTIKPAITIASVFWHLGLAAAVGSLAWLYPVHLALRIQPVAAMGER